MRSLSIHRIVGARIGARLLALSLGLVVTNTSFAALSDLSFKSNGLSFINDTIINGTSPLAFTDDTGLNAPFLNAGDSTITLDYGSYYALAFLGFGQHQGPGEISFRVNGGALITQAVTFPNPEFASAVFALFELPGGDEVEISVTGLANDRIRIIGDGGGLLANGVPDAYYQFNYTTAIPEPSASAWLMGGLVLLWAGTRRSRTAAF